MTAIDAVLDRYRRADPQTRLEMSLGHRDLRPLFECIEGEQRGATVTGPRVLTARRTDAVATLGPGARASAEV